MLGLIIVWYCWGWCCCWLPERDRTVQCEFKAFVSCSIRTGKVGNWIKLVWNYNYRYSWDFDSDSLLSDRERLRRDRLRWYHSGDSQLEIFKRFAISINQSQKMAELPILTSRSLIIELVPVNLRWALMCCSWRWNYSSSRVAEVGVLQV